MKSLMAWEVTNIVLADPITPGIAVYIDIEKKTNPDVIRGIIANDDLFIDKIMRAPLSTVSQMCTTMAEYAETYVKAVPKRDVPLAFLMDSLGALTGDEEIKAMNKTGNANEASGYSDARRAAEKARAARAVQSLTLSAPCPTRQAPECRGRPEPVPLAPPRVCPGVSLPARLRYPCRAPAP